MHEINIFSKHLCEEEKYYISNPLINSNNEEFKIDHNLVKIIGSIISIFNDKNEIEIKTDIVRSHPIFFCFSNGQTYISDRVDWLLDATFCKREINPELVEYFRKSGFVDGSETLLQGVYQAPPGSIVRIELENQEFNVIEDYNYEHTYKEKGEEQLLDEFDQVLINIFERLIEVTNGKKIIVPLSGGWDSRLILLMLKKLNYNNVAAFTYGTKNSKDATISKSIADQLGIDWYFVPYTTSMWNELFKSKEKEEFFKFSFNYSSLPHIQDWPAIREFKKKNTFPQESYIVPGHSADLPAGSFIEKYPAIYNAGSFDPDLVVNSLYKSLFSLHDDPKGEVFIKERFRESLISDYLDSATAFEEGFIKTKISNFLVNSMRTYEFYGYNWWLPFWDVNFWEFWKQVPIKYRRDQSLYKKYITQLQTNFDLKIDVTTKEKYPWYKPKFAKDYLKKIFNKTNLINQYEYHPLKWYGIMDEIDFNVKYSGNQHINSFLTDIIVNDLKSK